MKVCVWQCSLPFWEFHLSASPLSPSAGPSLSALSSHARLSCCCWWLISAGGGVRVSDAMDTSLMSCWHGNDSSAIELTVLLSCEAFWWWIRLSLVVKIYRKTKMHFAILLCRVSSSEINGSWEPHNLDLKLLKVKFLLYASIQFCRASSQLKKYQYFHDVFCAIILILYVSTCFNLNFLHLLFNCR